ncbi:hypothetical protein H4219_003552 [Mycoemilia scoparia]|uniref:Uncharacterized protein n=1 Tax=Mycoemilia scoparia TaxID=417184 RepID=A0A9W7ZUE0_9FUNG|nr:hypothetical protein H4219_003552 [Mycoemilia scoparia]
MSDSQDSIYQSTENPVTAVVNINLSESEKHQLSKNLVHFLKATPKIFKCEDKMLKFSDFLNSTIEENVGGNEKYELKKYHRMYLQENNRYYSEFSNPSSNFEICLVGRRNIRLSKNSKILYLQKQVNGIGDGDEDLLIHCDQPLVDGTYVKGIKRNSTELANNNEAAVEIDGGYPKYQLRLETISSPYYWNPFIYMLNRILHLCAQASIENDVDQWSEEAKTQHNKFLGIVRFFNGCISEEITRLSLSSGLNMDFSASEHPHQAEDEGFIQTLSCQFGLPNSKTLSMKLKYQFVNPSADVETSASTGSGCSEPNVNNNIPNLTHELDIRFTDTFVYTLLRITICRRSEMIPILRY